MNSTGRLRVDRPYMLIDLTTFLFEKPYANVKDTVHIASLVALIRFDRTY